MGIRARGGWYRGGTWDVKTHVGEMGAGTRAWCVDCDGKGAMGRGDGGRARTDRHTQGAGYVIGRGWHGSRRHRCACSAWVGGSPCPRYRARRQAAPRLHLSKCRRGLASPLAVPCCVSSADPPPCSRRPRRSARCLRMGSAIAWGCAGSLRRRASTDDMSAGGLPLPLTRQLTACKNTKTDTKVIENDCAIDINRIVARS